MSVTFHVCQRILSNPAYLTFKMKIKKQSQWTSGQRNSVRWVQVSVGSWQQRGQTLTLWPSDDITVLASLHFAHRNWPITFRLERRTWEKWPFQSCVYERCQFRSKTLWNLSVFVARQQQKTEGKPKITSECSHSARCVEAENDVPWKWLTLIIMFQGRRQHELRRCTITAAWLVQWRFWENINYDVLETTSTWWYHT